MNVTRYIVKVHPAAAPCDNNRDMVGSDCVIGKGENEFKEKALGLLLEVGVKYGVSVSTVNCGTQAGSYSEPIIIQLLCEHNASIPSQTPSH